MAKVQTDVGAIAGAIREFFSWLKIRMAGAELRNLKAAARVHLSYVKRVKKLFPKAKNDKGLKNYERKHSKLVI